MPPSELVAAIGESASELRDGFEEHRQWYSAAAGDPALSQLESDEAQRIHAEIGELLELLYLLHGCEKDGWSRETVFISDSIGQLEQVVDLHVQQVSAVESDLELRVEEGVYAVKVGEILDELDRHIEAAKIEAQLRPALRCGNAPSSRVARKNVPLI